MNQVRRKSAFTLIELLVVISIILIATSVLFVVGGGGGDGVKLSSAQRIVSSVAQGARGQAILKNASTRLIIYSDSDENEDDEKKLRYLGVIYANPDDPNPTNPTTWIAATQGTYLPEGVYFNEDLSDSFPGTRMTINYPRISAQTEGSGEEYFYYEFNRNGTMNSNYINSWLALQAGTLKPGGSGDLEISFDELDKQGLKAALIFRRVGTTTLVTDPSEIN